MTSLESKFVDWTGVPVEILANIFMKLDQHDRAKCSNVCKSWHQVCKVPELWRNVNLRFKLCDGKKKVEAVKLFGGYFKHIFLEVDQGDKRQRGNACEILHVIASFKEKSRLKSFTIRFLGENPLMYNGDEFHNGLSVMLDQLVDRKLPNVLKFFDVSAMQIVMKDEVILKLSKHIYLEHVNILTNTMLSTVKPETAATLIKNCKRLKVLKAFASSINDMVLEIFCQENRQKLEILSLVYQVNDNFKVPISDEVWHNVFKKNDNLKVEYQIDHNFAMGTINDHLTPGVPMSSIKFCTYTHTNEILVRAIDLYKHRLEYLLMWTPPSSELDSALIDAAIKCKKLCYVEVRCELDSSTLKYFNETRPDIKLNYINTVDSPVVGPEMDLLKSHALFIQYSMNNNYNNDSDDEDNSNN